MRARTAYRESRFAPVSGSDRTSTSGTPGNRCSCGTRAPGCRSSAFLSRRSCLARGVEHPLHAVFVGERAEIVAPEHLLQLHLDLAALRKRLEQPLRFAAGVRLEIDVHVIAVLQGEAHRFRRV